MEIKFKRDSSFRKQFFVPDSFAHPAKMDAQLLIWLTENYTNVGEVILDPMAGSGTMMLACTLGRDVMLVELEEKFCKMCADNWVEVKMRPQLGYAMGDCQIIQGDARNLEGLLADKVLMLPPHGNRLSDVAVNDGDPQRMSYRQALADKIITSPPYADIPMGGGLNTKPPREGYNDQSGRSPQSPSQLGAGKYADKIITSPPYAETVTQGGQTGAHKDKYGYQGENQGYSRNDGNIGNLPYGNIDKIITSPPYEQGGQGVGTELHPERMVGSETGLGRGYPETAGNIGNLKGATYLEAMSLVYSQCFTVLKDGGLLILVTKNFIRNRQVIRLDEDTIKLCEQAGFSFVERHFRKLPAQSFWRTIYQQKYPDVEVIQNEDVLIFRKLIADKGR